MNRCENPDKPLGNVNTKGKIDGYEYRYMGGSTILKKPWKNTINQISDTLKLTIMMLFSFNKKDKAILYSYSSLLLKLVVACAKIKGFEVYFELNEHPAILYSLFGVKYETEKDLAAIKRKLIGVNGVLCISAALKELLVRSGLSKECVHVVNMLVDSSRFADIKKEKAEPYIGYCGAADNKKDGVDQLIKAFGRIAEKNPELKLHIMGPKTVDGQNEQLVNSLKLEDRVLFTGVVGYKELPQRLVNASILALDRPQSIQAKYGFPTKLGEYLSTGNPVVVTSVGDIPFFLKDGESAYLAEPDDIAAFADKLDYVLSHPDESERVGKCGREVALKNFSGKQVMSQLKSAMNL